MISVLPERRGFTDKLLFYAHVLSFLRTCISLLFLIMQRLTVNLLFGFRAHLDRQFILSGSFWNERS